MVSGVLYVATKDNYISEAMESVSSLKKRNDIQCAIIVPESDIPKTNLTNAFDEVIGINPFGNVMDKSFNLTKSPFEKTLYLDTDTKILGDLSPLFDLLDRFDIALARSNTKELVEIEGVPDAFPQFNSGVIAYNMNDSVMNTFDTWEKLYKKQIEVGRPNESLPVEHGDTLEEVEAFGKMTDQPPLREAIYKNDIKFVTLPSEYNYGSWGRSYAYGKVKIIHGNTRRREMLKEHINQRIYPRIYLGSWFGILLFEDGKSKKLFPVHERMLNIFVRKLPIRAVAKRLGIMDELREINHRIKR